MDSKNDNSEIISSFNIDEINDELFEFLVLRYQSDLETSIKGTNFVFDGLDVLHYKCNKIRLDCGPTYILIND